MNIKSVVFLLCVACMANAFSSVAQLPTSYKGKPFRNSAYLTGPQAIPGRVELAYYDFGGEGVAYHDADSINKGSGELNLKPDHARPGVPEYIVHFREKEGVDISFTKDFAVLITLTK